MSRDITMERMKGIEPSSSGWKPEALPLSYIREAANRTGRPCRRGNRFGCGQGTRVTVPLALNRSLPPSNRWKRPPLVPAGSSSDSG